MPGILTALTLTGCKDDQGTTTSQPSDQASQPAESATPDSQSPAPGSDSPSPPPGGDQSGTSHTKLTITVRMGPSAAPITRTLTCDPPGGDAPNAAGACAGLDKAAAAKGGDPFAPTPKGQMCTQIFGGPQTATVKGTYKGKKVDTTFARRNGYEVKRWNDVAALLGPLAHTPTH